MTTENYQPDAGLLDAIRAHAAAEAPRECCGLVIVERGRAAYVRCRNLAAHGGDYFILPPEDFAAAEERGAVMAVAHSHPFTPPEPSMADRAACEASGLPWLIVNHPEGEWQALRPAGYRAPLFGRPFVHGVFDCYALVRDWFAQEREITLPEFERREDWWLKDGGRDDLLTKNFARAGFVEIAAEEVQDGDCFLMQMPGSEVSNHCGVFTAGGAQIIHQVSGRLSSRDVYGGLWRKATTHLLRFRTPAAA